MTDRRSARNNMWPAFATGSDGARTDARMEVKIDSGGGIVIPAAFLHAMEAGEGDMLVAPDIEVRPIR